MTPSWRSGHFRRALLVLAVALATVAVSGCTASWSTSQGKTISPDGSAYSYGVPQGFFIEDRSGLPGRLQRHFESGVYFPTGAVVIRVNEQTLTRMVADTPGHAATIEKAFVGEASGWANPATDWRRTTVAGASALRYHLGGRSLDGKHQEAEEVAVFSGPHLIYVSCNWESDSERATALKGCEEVIKSLRINA